MVMETGVELVEVICPKCGYRWTCSYELVHDELPSGAVCDYFSAEGLPVPSPYAPDGAPPCLRCAWRAVARFVARRFRKTAPEALGGKPAPRRSRS